MNNLLLVTIRGKCMGVVLFASAMDNLAHHQSHEKALEKLQLVHI